MASIADAFQAFRLYNTPGVSGTGVHSPDQDECVAVGATIETRWPKKYVSSQQVISAAGTVTLTHNLTDANGDPALPDFVTAEIVCQTGGAEYNYADGAVVPIDIGAGDSTNTGLSVQKTVTQLIVRYGSATNPINIDDATTGNHQFATNANWKLVVRAFYFPPLT